MSKATDSAELVLIPANDMSLTYESSKMLAYELWDFDPEISEIIPVRLNTHNSHSSVYGEVSHQPFSDHSHYMNNSMCMSYWDFPIGLYSVPI